MASCVPIQRVGSLKEGVLLSASSSRSIRWGIVGAMLASVAWMVAALLEIVVGEVLGPVLVAYLLAWLGTLGGLVGLRAVQQEASPRGGGGWVGLTGFLVAFGGALLALAGSVLTLVGATGVPIREELGDQALGLGFFVGLLGLALFGVGFVLWGVAIVWRRSMPAWSGVLMIVGLLAASMLAWWGGGANVVLGLLWLGLGYALWLGGDQRPRPSVPPRRDHA